MSLIIYVYVRALVQLMQIERGVDVVVGTPGRIQDLIDRQALVI